jgi:iron complex outermembrane recepter protein
MIRKTYFMATLMVTTAIPAFADEGIDDPTTIVVSGQKLQQSIQETPNSVVVATSEQIDQPANADIQDYLRNIPNIVFTTGGQLPFVRGVDGNGVAIGGNGAVSGGRPRISTYVDGVPRSFSFLPNGVPVTWDIAQLEFYRGAQSTGLGRNAMAGAIVVQTADPEDRAGGAAQIGIRSKRTTLNGAATFNLPIIADRLAARVSVDGFDGDNYINYVGPFAGRENFISKDKGHRLRAKLAFRPRGFNDEMSFRLAYEKQYARRASPEDTAREFELSDPSSGSVFELDTELLSAEAKIPLNDSVSIYAIASYQDAREKSLPIFTDGNSLDVFANSEEYTQEARISYSPADSRLRGVIGAFNFTRDRLEGGVPGSAFVYDATDKGSTIAVFADVVIPVGQFDILAGGRWERERQRRNFLAIFGLGLDVDIKQDIFLPKAGLRWNISTEQSLTALYFKGYSPAAAAVSFTSFTPYQFERETSDTIELAWRMTDGPVTINANIFGTWYKGQQVNGAGPLGPADAIIVNAERTRYYGAEADVTWRANNRLSLSMSIGLLDSTIVRFGGDLSNDLKNGNDLPFAPSVSGGVSAQWQPMDRLTLNAKAVYSAAKYSLDENSAADRIGSQILFDASAGYDFGRFSIHAFVENVFDKFYFLAKDPVFGAANVGRPRTFGAAIRVGF